MRAFLAVIVLFALGALARCAPSPPHYDEQHALLAYQYSKIAVCDLADILAFNCSACGNSTRGFFTSWAVESDTYDVQVYVGFDAPRFMIVVAFRGSKTLANWINDMRFAHVDTPFPACSGCFLHKGFITSYNSIAVPLFVAVAQLRAQYNTTRIMVTGHSLGGALAQLAALDLTVHDEFAALTPLLYTFGSPRIGNNNFQLYMQSKTMGWRVVNQHDVVPQLPPGNGKLLFDFHHAPREIWYINDTVRVCDSSGEDPTCQDSLKAKQLRRLDHGSYFNMSSECNPMFTPAAHARARD